MSVNDKHTISMIATYLEQVNYWHDRFEVSRNIDHLDNAERHAEVARMYLPECFQCLSIIGLCNLYQSSPSLHPDRSGG